MKVASPVRRGEWGNVPVEVTRLAPTLLSIEIALIQGA